MNQGVERRIYRSTSERVIGGVGGGLGEYLGVDPVLIRLSLIALALTGAGILLYVVAWIAIPEAPAGHSPTRPRGDGSGARIVVGSVLVAVGGLLLLDWVLPIGRIFWPLALIAIGIGVFVVGRNR